MDVNAFVDRWTASGASERAAEEARGHVRWLRPEYQRPLAGETGPANTAIPGLEGEESAAGTAEVAKAKWPATLSDRISAVRAAVLRAPGPVRVEDVARGFARAPRKNVASILDSLAALGIVGSAGEGEDRRWRAAR